MIQATIKIFRLSWKMFDCNYNCVFLIKGEHWTWIVFWKSQSDGWSMSWRKWRLLHIFTGIKLQLSFYAHFHSIGVTFYLFWTQIEVDEQSHSFNFLQLRHGKNTTVLVLRHNTRKDWYCLYRPNVGLLPKPEPIQDILKKYKKVWDVTVLILI